MVSSPAVDANGTIYFGSSDKTIYALNPNGTLKWKHVALSKIVSGPAIANDGTIYVAATMSDEPNPQNYASFSLYAFTPDDTVRWIYEIGAKGISSPTIGPDGTIYFGTTSHYIYALSPDLRSTGAGENGSMFASPKWCYETNGEMISTPAIGKDGTIYVGSMEDAFDQHHQDIRRSDEIIGTGQYLYALSSDGSLKWKFLVEGDACSSPSIGSDGTLYFVDWSWHLYALNDDGTLKWRYGPIMASGPGGFPFSSPAIGIDGTIYVNDGRAMCAIN